MGSSGRRRWGVVFVQVLLDGCDQPEGLAGTMFVWMVNLRKILISHIHITKCCAALQAKYGQCRACEIHGSKATDRKSESSSNNAT